MTDLQKEAWGPEGDASRHLATEVLRAALVALPPAPTATQGGVVALLVKRHPDGSRTTHDDATLSVDDGLVGDGWSRRPPRNVEAQVTVMRRDIGEVIANGQDLTLFGDNVIVDLDLSDANLPAGTRLRVGDAEVEVTSKPHNGCSKYKARFGADALAVVQDPVTRNQNLRGIHWRVVASGRVWVGAPIVVLARAPHATL